MIGEVTKFEKMWLSCLKFERHQWNQLHKFCLFILYQILINILFVITVDDPLFDSVDDSLLEDISHFPFAKHITCAMTPLADLLDADDDVPKVSPYPNILDHQVCHIYEY